MKRNLVVTAIVVLVLLPLCLMWNPQTSSDSSDSSDRVAAVIADKVPSMTGEQSDVPTGGDVRREEVTTDGKAAAARTNPYSSVVITGRCVSELGGGLSGCSVFLRTLQRPQLIWNTVKETTTSSTGEFELRLLDAVKDFLGIRVIANGLTERTCTLLKVLPGSRHDLGEVVLYEAATVKGRIVDPKGLPVARRHLSFTHQERLPLVGRWTFGFINNFSTKSLADGEFKAARTLRTGTWQLRMGEGYTLVRPKEVELQGSVVDLLVVARKNSVIAGRVRKTDGTGVAGIQLRAIDPETKAWLSQYSRPTTDDGRFTIEPEASLDRKGEVAAVELIDDPLFKWQILSGAKQVWGVANARIVLHPKAILSLEVVDADSGGSLNSYKVSCSRRVDEFRWIKIHEPREGKARIPLSSGDWFINVLPSSADHLVSDTVSIVVGEATPALALKIELKRQDPIRVTVSGAGGPVAGSLVQMINAKQEAAMSASSVIKDKFVNRSFYDSRIRDDGPFMVSSAKTDASGVARLRNMKNWNLAYIRVAGPKHAPLLRRVHHEELESGQIRIKVTAGGSVEGNIRYMGKEARIWGVRLQRMIGGRKDVFPLGGFERLENWQYRLEHVPPGNWDLSLIEAGRSIAQLLFAIRVDEGKTTTVAVCKVAAQSSVGGSVRFRGRKVDGVLELKAMARSRLEFAISIHGGKLERTVLPPGVYGVRLSLDKKIQGKRQIIVVPANRVGEIDLDFK